MTNMPRLTKIAESLPEVVRVDVEAWGGEPTFRVRKKNFVFTNADATQITVKLDKAEAEALTATDADAQPTRYGLGRNGWVTIRLGSRPGAARWREVEEWVRTSYALVAPATLARQVVPAPR